MKCIKLVFHQKLGSWDSGYHILEILNNHLGSVTTGQCVIESQDEGALPTGRRQAALNPECCIRRGGRGRGGSFHLGSHSGNKVSKDSSAA